MTRDDGWDVPARQCSTCRHYELFEGYTICWQLHDGQEGNIVVKPTDYCTMFYEPLYNNEEEVRVSGVPYKVKLKHLK